MRLVSPDKLSELQRDPERIRNICILAHVDHGKTTLADALVASNGIISSKLAGKLRYLDSRTDEQERGITMKSSSIALYHTSHDSEFVVNLIDSPGHVDFASEVSTAVRLCDGALIVVDVIEGVCPQTRSALSIAYIEGLKPILVFNKIDRLITTVQLSPLDAYVHLMQLLEQVNAVTGELFASDVMARGDKQEASGTDDGNLNERNLADWQSTLEEADDSNLYFLPEHGNVLFASAFDGWGFGVKEFAKIFSDKLWFSEKVLLKTLWGDYYLNNKTKRIMKGAQEKAKKPLFVQLILENIWAVYDTAMVRKDKEKMSSIAEKLGVKLTTRDLRLTDSRAQLQAVFSQWLPLAKACLDATCDIVPSPTRLTEEKIERLMSGNTDFSALPHETQSLKDAFLACDSSPEAPVIIFVSKMFPVDRKTLPENKAKPLTQEELTQRKEIARQRHAAQLEQRQSGAVEPDKENIAEPLGAVEHSQPAEELAEDVLVAFARVYSGTLRKGSEVFVLGPKHNPRVALELRQNGEEIEEGAVLKDLRPGRHATRATINQLYLMMGRELEPLESISAGNVVGIGNLEEHVLKTATLSTSIACSSFAELTSLTDPILRVALEPRQPNDLQKLIKGLKMLNQADACAVVHIQETGEIVLNTAGEVHLERCLEDLRMRYAKVELNVSEPIVPLRETVVPPPKLDMVNEVIENKKQEGNLEFWTANRQCCFEIDARPLPDAVTKTLEKHAELIKLVDQHVERLGKSVVEEGLPNVAALSITPPVLPERTLKAVETFRAELKQGFEENGEKVRLERIWCFGPRKCGPNILINDTSYERKPFWEPQIKSADPRASYDSNIVNGFQLATLAGPLCEEPMMGVCFVLKKWEIYENSSGDGGSQSHQGHLGGQLMSACKEACRRALSLRRPRLVTPMYSCSVLVNSDVLGKLYAVFGRRQGRVITADSASGFGGQFRVFATLPVPESFHLARELRTQTSGLASPQLVFSHWEVIEQDPYWVPSTEEEYLHFGEKADSGNRAKRYMDLVRRRKGLPVDSQLVTHGEKQRTLSRKK